MKKIIKNVITFILILIISCSFSPAVFAYSYGTINIKSMVDVKKHDNKEIRTINYDNLKRIRNSKSNEYKNMSDEKKLENIFKALDFEVDSFQLKKISESLSLLEIENIQIEESYIKMDDNGDCTSIGKNEAVMSSNIKNDYLSSLTLDEYYTITTSSTGPTASHGNDEPIIDPSNYMAQQIAVIYTPNYNGNGTTIGRYATMVSFNWLTVPFTRKSDCMGLYTGQFNWLDRIAGEDSNYFLLATYYKSLYNSNGDVISTEQISEDLDEDDAIISNSDGFCFKYNLKNNFLQIQYTGFSFLLFGVCRVRNYANPYQSLAISSDYLHVNSLLSISPSFSIGPVGISISSTSLSISHFRASHEWDYYNDYIA